MDGWKPDGRLLNSAMKPWRGSVYEDDLEQEVTLALWQNRGKGLSDGALIVAARRRAIDWVRSTAGRGQVGSRRVSAKYLLTASTYHYDAPFDNDGTTFGDVLHEMGVEDHRPLLAQLEELDLPEREHYIVMMLLVGWTAREAAEKLGVTESRVSQIMRMLRLEMAALFDVDQFSLSGHPVRRSARSTEPAGTRP